VIKSKLKQIIKRRMHQSVILNLDLVFSGVGETILLGWVVNREVGGEDDTVECLFNDSILLSSQMTFERPDVESHLSLKAEERCFGFVMVVEGVAPLDEAVLVYGKNKFSIANQHFVKVSNVNEISAHVGSEVNSVIEFLKGCGVNLDEGSTNTPKSFRELDRDIEKIKYSLNELNVHSSDFVDDCSLTLLPEMQKLWETRQSKNNNARLKVFGEQHEATRLSIIIPLYGRYDFMQHQLAHFASDPAMRDVELIYVLDDPPLGHEVNIVAFGLYQTFGLPFKVVFSEYNLGFSGANNLGVSFASGEHILLLNSDIIPTKDGWITDYLEQFSGLSSSGILGATLVYEDHTVQHVGMEFREDSSYPGIWMNHHPYKGVPLSMLDKKGVSQVQLVTGACMLMRRALFEEVGGFDTLYVLGDFEDSDLCLKCIDKGFDIYVSHDVVMYHLERLSQDLVDSGDWKFKLTLANGVYQTNKWRELIDEVTA
jgi:GT2 family glycosyltransferase